MFLKKYKEKIRELEITLECQSCTITALDKEREELKKQLRGERVVSRYCVDCVHCINAGGFDYGVCGLECKCKDFK